MSQRIEDRLKELKNWPPLEPPAALEGATLAAMAAALTDRGRLQFGRAATWAAVAVTGALMAALTFSPWRATDTQSADVAAPANVDAGVNVEAFASEADYIELLEQSVYLEQLLAQLPQRQVMRVGTAGTIVGLEEQIAMIDTALFSFDIGSVPPEHRLALARDRVEVMNALVNVRYAQSRAFTF